MLRIKRRGVRALRTGGMWLVLGGYLFAYIGFPVPQPSEKDVSLPFPCAQRACGCMSADACWDHCCCFTDKQKLVWAAKHNVTVPQRVVDRCASQSHIAAAGKSAPCCQVSHSKERSCCTKAAPSKSKSVKWVDGMQARKCRGQGVDWLSVGAVLPPTPPTNWIPQSPCIGAILIADELFDPPAQSPPIPPPRLAVRT